MVVWTQETRRLGVQTTLGEDVFLLTGFEGTEQLSRLFSYRLDLVSLDYEIHPKEIVGHPIGFSVRSGEEQSSRFFHGIVKRFSAGNLQDQGLRRYSAEVVPWFWVLTRAADCRVFQKESVKGIVESVFQDFGCTDYDLSGLLGDHPERDYCVQYRETAFNFLSRLMEDEGIFFYFRHEQDKHTLVLADDKSSYYYGEQREVPFNNGSLVPNRISSWERQYDFPSGRWTQTDYDFKNPDASLGTTTKTLVERTGNDRLEMFDYPGGYTKRDSGEPRTRIRMEEQESEHDTATGTSSCATFSPGMRFQLNYPEFKSESKGFMITSVSHSAREALSFVNGDTNGTEIYGNSFSCIPDSVNFRPARVTPVAEVRGPQTAVVVGPPGQKIHTDKYGRVKVQFHWDRKGQSTDKSSCWIRVSQNWGGSGWGGMFVPHVGQEVIISFVNGNPDRPLVTGRVYNKQQMPPRTLPDHKTSCIIQDHGGDYCNLEGADGKQAIDLYSKTAKTQIVLGRAPDPVTSHHFPEVYEIAMPHGSTVGPLDGFNITTEGNLVAHVGLNFHFAIKGKSEWMIEKEMNEEIKGFYNGRVQGTYTKKVENEYKLTVENASYTAIVTSNYNLTAKQGNMEFNINQGNWMVDCAKDITFECRHFKVNNTGNMTVADNGNLDWFTLGWKKQLVIGAKTTGIGGLKVEVIAVGEKKSINGYKIEKIRGVKVSRSGDTDFDEHVSKLVKSKSKLRFLSPKTLWGSTLKILDAV